jgi:hypothetical protein
MLNSAKSYLLHHAAQGLMKMAVSLTPLLVHTVRHVRITAYTSAHTGEIGCPSFGTELGQRDWQGRYKFTLSITNIPPGFNLSNAARAQYSR